MLCLNVAVALGQLILVLILILILDLVIDINMIDCI